MQGQPLPAQQSTSSVQAATRRLKFSPSTRVFGHVSTRSVTTAQEVAAAERQNAHVLGKTASTNA